jgi:hypothetical protein
MAKKYRVMRSTLGHGVSVAEDCISSRAKAAGRAKSLNYHNKDPKVLGYFAQEYEECRELYK